MSGYQRWLIARGNAFLPGTEAVAKLVEKLRAEGWIGPGGQAVKTVEAGGASAREPIPDALTRDWLDRPDREEIRLVWSGEGERKYPLSHKPAGAKWKLEVHRAPEYVYPSAKGIGAIDTMCRCGEDQAFEWDLDDVVPAFEASTGIFAECEECSRTFDPTTRSATIANAFDGSETEVTGGASYRFAVKVDCGDAFVADASLAFAPELVKLVEEHFGRDFFEVGAKT